MLVYQRVTPIYKPLEGEQPYLGDGFQTIFLKIPNLEEMIQFWLVHIFQRGLVQPRNYSRFLFPKR